MPQMAPMNWMILFIYFLIILYMIMNMIYFNFNKKIKINQSNKTLTKNYNKFI